MESSEKALSVLIFVAIMKTTSEYSSVLINELKQKPKHDFNVFVKQLDGLIKTMESSLNSQELELLESLNSEFCNFIMEVRKSVVINTYQQS